MDFSTMLDQMTTLTCVGVSDVQGAMGSVMSSSSQSPSRLRASAPLVIPSRSCKYKILDTRNLLV